MPSNDARTLLHTVLPTAAAGVIAAVISGVVAGGKGAIGALVGALVVIVFMGLGQVVLIRTAKSLPQLFQAMGLMLYVAQLLLLMIFVAIFKDTTLFNPKTFAVSLLLDRCVDGGPGPRSHEGQGFLYRPRGGARFQGDRDR